MTHPLDTYVSEQFTAEERAVLERYFTNVDGPVFCLINLPEVVKGALFARYSRTSKSLRRLFLDEFAGELGALGSDDTSTAEVEASAEERASQLYRKIFGEYGDDSVAQLGFVHLACEQVSNVLTKAIEWGRLASYLEQSTRYIAYTDRLENGRYRYYHDPEILSGNYGEQYHREMDAMFAEYTAAFEAVNEHLLATTQPESGTSERAWRAAARAKALDACRGMLPAGTVSNLGVAASGQAYEHMILRLRSHPLAEARAYAELILSELIKVIPDFLSRLDRPDRGGVWVEYLSSTRENTRMAVTELGVGQGGSESPSGVELVAYDPKAEEKLIAAAIYPHTQQPLSQLEAEVGAMSPEGRAKVLRAYIGDRLNRRHKPGRAFERAVYEFDIVCDYGAFRDLQRHRLATMEWQQLNPNLGYDLPALIAEAGQKERYEAQMKRSAELWRKLQEEGHTQAAQYAVALGYRIRFRLGMNAREAMHICELRSQPQGHITYRVIAQEIWRQIRDVAGHTAIADAMSFVDLSGDGLGRLEAEARLDRRKDQSRSG